LQVIFSILFQQQIFFYNFFLDRTLVEQDSDQILEDANEKNIAFLVVGDPFGYYYFKKFNIQNSDRF
jgi:hypothetical protein